MRREEFVRAVLGSDFADPEVERADVIDIGDGISISVDMTEEQVRSFCESVYRRRARNEMYDSYRTLSKEQARLRVLPPETADDTTCRWCGSEWTDERDCPRAMGGVHNFHG